MEAHMIDAEPAAASVATLNFIVFVDDAGHREWVRERAERIAAKHPCRMIVLDATGSATTEPAGGGRRTIDVYAMDAATVASIAKEFSVPGAPGVLWWSGREIAGETLARLLENTRTLIVDSSAHERGEARIRAVAEFAAAHPAVRFHDLAFLRLGPWMDMIAQFFDDAALREDLFFIRGLSIESGSEAEARYLAGWLGSRLSWEPVDGHAFRARDGSPVRLDQTIAGDMRRVRRVVLTSDDSTYVAELAEADANTVCLTVTGAKAKPMRCAPLQNVDNVSLIERALLRDGRDVIFDTSLETVRGLLR
jgi:glucose-6-phosphate dehydrogenase assembly protein OpcA